MNRLLQLMALAALVVAFACGGLPSAPTPPTVEPPVVAPPAPPAPTLPSSFSFVDLGPETMGMSPSELKVWGLRGANTRTAVAQMVFGDSSGHNNPGLRPLVRLPIGGSVSVSIPASLAGKMEEYKSGAKAWQELTGIAMAFVSGSSPFSVEIGDAGGFSAITRRSFDGAGIIVSATVIFRSLDEANSYTIRHEFSHIYGMNHHEGVGLLGTSYDPQKIAYSQPEVDNAAMMSRVATGASFPSATTSSLAVSSSPARVTTETVVCRLGR